MQRDRTACIDQSLRIKVETLPEKEEKLLRVQFQVRLARPLICLSVLHASRMQHATLHA